METEIRELRAELSDVATSQSAAQDQFRRICLRLDACERAGHGERVVSVERCLREEAARRWQEHEARHVALNELLAESDGAALTEIANERSTRKAAITNLEGSLSEHGERLRRDLQALISEQGERLRQDIQVALCDQLRAALSEQESVYRRELDTLETKVQASICELDTLEQIASVQTENEAGHLALRALLTQHASAQDVRVEELSRLQSEQHSACQRALEAMNAGIESRISYQKCEDSAERCTKMCEELASQRAGIFADHRDRLMNTFDALRSGVVVGPHASSDGNLEMRKCNRTGIEEDPAQRSAPEDTQQNVHESDADCQMKAFAGHRDSLLSSLDTLQCSVQTDIGHIWPIIRDLLAEHVSAHDAKQAILLDKLLQEKSAREQQHRSMSAALEDLEAKLSHTGSEPPLSARGHEGPHQFLARDHDARLAQEKRERERQVELLNAAIEGIDTKLSDMGVAARHDRRVPACDSCANLQCRVQEHTNSLRVLESTLTAEAHNLRCSFKDLQADSLKVLDSMVEAETRNLRCSFEDFEHALHAKSEERDACVKDALSKQASALDRLRVDCRDELERESVARETQQRSLQTAVFRFEEKERLRDMEESITTLPQSHDALAQAAGWSAEQQESISKEQRASLEALLERRLDGSRSDAAACCASLGVRMDDLQRRLLEERDAREARCTDLQGAIRHTDADLHAEIARVADEQQAGLAALRHRLAAQPSEASTIDTEALDEVRSVLEGRLDAESHARETGLRFLQNSLMTMETQVHERISRRSRQAKPTSSTSSRLLPDCSDAIASTTQSKTLSNTTFSQNFEPGAARLLPVDSFSTAGFGGNG